MMRRVVLDEIDDNGFLASDSSKRVALDAVDDDNEFLACGSSKLVVLDAVDDDVLSAPD